MFFFFFIDKNIFYQVSTDLFNNKNDDVHLLYINYITYIILFLLIKITCTCTRWKNIYLSDNFDRKSL